MRAAGCRTHEGKRFRGHRQYGGGNKVPFPNLSAYTASKGGIEIFTRCAAVELGPFGIRVNCVAPGAIDTERTQLEMANFAESWAQITPVRRIGTPEEVASAVEFLLGESGIVHQGTNIVGRRRLCAAALATFRSQRLKDGIRY